jgi:hypothetical protein
MTLRHLWHTSGTAHILQHHTQTFYKNSKQMPHPQALQGTSIIVALLDRVQYFAR